ncbi:MAG: hypothetical protein RL243_863, partial [Actinomycetota bacterium]
RNRLGDRRGDRHGCIGGVGNRGCVICQSDLTYAKNQRKPYEGGCDFGEVFRH